MELTFTPEEFVVLEDIEFDETVQRTEAVRFYTMDEQEVDAYEKMIPKGRVTQFARDEVRKQVGRLRVLYEHFVLPTSEAYQVREPEFARNFSWIRPVYATPKTTEYNWDTQWRAIYANLRQPNYYSRMIAALPRPYAEANDGAPYPLGVPTEFVSVEGQNPNRALPAYVRTRAQVVNATVSIVPDPIKGSEDVVPFVGYHAAKRPVPIPNPLEGHPLFKSNESTFIGTTGELKEIAPSLDAILTHGVPVTQDPYRVAAPYLKVYDVKLSDIPWSAWKSKFPQTDRMEGVPETEPIPFPKPAQNAPGEKIQSVYGSKYFEGVSCRHWLSLRPDGGEFVIKALMSKTIDNGSVESIPGADLPSLSYPATTPQECTLMGISFQDFNLRGILRRTWIIDHRKTGDVDLISFACVPLEFIKQERARVGYLNRLPWTDSTATDILEKHQRALRANRLLGEVVEKVSGQSKTPSPPQSAKRVEVLALFHDPRRFASDKFRDITELLRDTTLTNNIHSDNEGGFVACDHMLAILSGDFADDRLAFYDKWTAREDGFRVCKFCGEHVDSIEEDGRVIPGTTAVAKVSGIAEFATGLTALKGLFNLTNPMDFTCYLLLTLLHVLPTEDTQNTLGAILEIARTIKLGKEDTEEARRAKGATGIAIAIMLLQLHMPALLPRRSFGSKALKLNGYPRDLDKPERFSIVDSMIKVIKKTFEEELSTGLRGPSQDIINLILNTPTKAKKLILVGIGLLLPNPNKKSAEPPVNLSEKLKEELKEKLKEKLKEAKDYHANIPKVEEPDALIPVVLPPETMNVIKSYAECPSARPILGGPNPPKTSQPTVPLDSGIHAAKGARFLQPTASARQGLQDVPKADIQKRIAMEKNVKSKIPVTDEYRTNLILASRLTDILKAPNPVSSVNPNQKPAELRDVARGFVYEALTKLPDVDRTKDIALYALTTNYTEMKALVKKLRATERITFKGKLSEMSDAERAVVDALVKVGLRGVTDDNERLENAQKLENEMDGKGEEEDEDEGEGEEEGDGEAEGEGEEEGDGEAEGEGEGDGTYGDSQVSIYSG